MAAKVYDARDGDRGIVYLNGHPVDYVQQACPEDGWLVKYAQGEDGEIITKDDFVEYERLEGDVKVLQAENDI